MASLCRFLEWDSDFFGVRIARLQPARSRPAMERALRRARRDKIDCLYFLAGAGDAPAVRFAEDNGFRLMDLRVTLETEGAVRRGARRPKGFRFRLFAPADAAALEAIAGESHRDSRFFADPRFERARCRELYRTWIRKSCEGRADAVWVAEARGAAVGYVTCVRRGKGRGEIGLVGVAPGARGKGVGHRLLVEALRWFSRKGVKRVRVATQGRNPGAQRLYERAGFATRAVELSYHAWLREPKSRR